MAERIKGGYFRTYDPTSGNMVRHALWTTADQVEMEDGTLLCNLVSDLSDDLAGGASQITIPITESGVPTETTASPTQICQNIGALKSVNLNNGYEDGLKTPISSNCACFYIGHRHLGNPTSGGGCYTEQTTEVCNARINWYRREVDSPDGHPNQYRYRAWGTCLNGHGAYAERWSPTGVDPGEIRYQPCRQSKTVYLLPTGHPEEGQIMRTTYDFDGTLADNEKIVRIQYEEKE